VNICRVRSAFGSIESVRVGSWLALAVIAIAADARGDEGPPQAAAKPVIVDVAGGTYFPLSITAEGNVELPYRILARADVGWMPSPYSNTIVDVIGDLGAINSFEENLLKLSIQNSFVARLAAGWRPFPKLGFEALVGYTLVTVGGGVSGTDVIAAYLQSKGSTDAVPPNARHDVPISTTLHNFDATLGWRFLFFDDHLVVRATLGYMQCFASSTGVQLSSPRPAEQAAAAKINADIQGFLNPYYTTYVKIPVVGVTAGYRF
jgi:hypothetical protein